MLGIFSFVFAHIFQARWPEQASDIPFALNLYCGLIAFNIFAETVGRAPSAVRSHSNYVKKMIFPVEILPVVPLGAAIIHGCFNISILVGALAWTGNLNSTILLFPVLLIPLLLFGIGLSWFLAAWGVFIRDMSQIVPVFVQMLLFLSPIFYPVQAVPVALQAVYTMNPLSSVIEALRASISGGYIDWFSWSVTLFISFIVFVIGCVFFHKSRDEFADVL
jgi:lipopolysaccharide transport system permease protein